MIEKNLKCDFLLKNKKIYKKFKKKTFNFKHLFKKKLTNLNNFSYYRLDGQCNNIKNPLLGSIHSPFLRLLEDGYDDGYEVVSKIRTEESPRADSNVANTARGLNENLSPETSSDMATMAFQILTHELMMTLKSQVCSRDIYIR